MTHVRLEDAQVRLADLMAAAIRGEEVVITRPDDTAVRLVPVAPPSAKPRPRFGSAKASILHMADDFDAPLEDFEEYMK